jgi:predicted dehydrogenase
VAYRVGVVGAGFGGNVHVPAYKAHPAFELVAIASPNKAAQIARAQQIPHAFASLDAMLDGVELDLVSVASPPFDHHGAVKAALARGKNVLCEKPLATSVRLAREMLDLAARAGTVCGVSHEFRFTASRHAIKELVDNGHLGALREIEITDFRTNLRAEMPSRPGWWFSKERGGGLAQALTSHFIDNANWIAGRAPKLVAGTSRTANPARRTTGGETFATDVADGIFIVLDYGDGLVARITTDATVAVASHVFAVHGERMTAVASGPTQIQTQTFTVDGDETNELGLRPSPYAKYAAVNPNVPLFLELLDELAKALDGKPNSLPTFEEALATQVVLEAIGYVVV